jgi:hypothetical protein
MGEPVLTINAPTCGVNGCGRLLSECRCKDRNAKRPARLQVPPGVQVRNDNEARRVLDQAADAGITQQELNDFVARYTEGDSMIRNCQPTVNDDIEMPMEGGALIVNDALIARACRRQPIGDADDEMRTEGPPMQFFDPVINKALNRPNIINSPDSAPSEHGGRFNEEPPAGSTIESLAEQAAEASANEDWKLVGKLLLFIKKLRAKPATNELVANDSMMPWMRPIC